MRGVIIFIVILMSAYAVDDTPLVPSQIDGKVLDEATPVIGATVSAYIDEGDDCILVTELKSGEYVTLDSVNDSFDGYFRITIPPEQYEIGVTDVVLTVSHEGKSAFLCVQDIVEGTMFGNDLHLTDSDADGDGFTTDVDCDDENIDVNPGADEICNGIDDNCNEEIDEGAEICSANDFSLSQCDYDDDVLTLDSYSFLSECIDEACTEKPEDWEDYIVSDCDTECGACLANEDCGPSQCPEDGCDGGVYKVYEGTAGECVDCACTSECTFTEPYDGEVCDDDIDNDCDSLVNEGCTSLGEPCTGDWECVLGAYCPSEGICTEIQPYCSLYQPTLLYTSWNLIGFPSCADMPVEEGLSSIAGKYGDVFVLEMGVWKNFNPSSPVEMNSLETLKSLQGIYINVSEDTTLIIVP